RKYEPPGRYGPRRGPRSWSQGEYRSAQREGVHVSTVHPQIPGRLAVAASEAHLPWLIALAGFAVMFAPVWWSAANGIWQTDENGHGPIILAVLLYLFWPQWRDVVDAPDAEQPLP